VRLHFTIHLLRVVCYVVVDLLPLVTIAVRYGSPVVVVTFGPLPLLFYRCLLWVPLRTFDFDITPLPVRACTYYAFVTVTVWVRCCTLLLLRLRLVPVVAVPGYLRLRVTLPLLHVAVCCYVGICIVTLLTGFGVAVLLLLFGVIITLYVDRLRC